MSSEVKLLIEIVSLDLVVACEYGLRRECDFQNPPCVSGFLMGGEFDGGDGVLGEEIGKVEILP